MGPIPGSAVREGASSSTNWASSCSQDRAFGTQCFSTSRDKAQSLARDLKSRHCRGRRRSCKRIGYGGHSIPSAFPPGNTSTARRGRPSSPTQRVDAVTAVQLRAVQMPGGTVGQLVATNQPGRLHPGPGIRHQEPLHEVSRVREVSRVGQPPPRRAHLPIRGDVEPRADLYVLGAGARVDLAVGSLRPQDDVRGQRWWPLAEVVAHVDLLGQKLEVLIASASNATATALLRILAAQLQVQYAAQVAAAGGDASTATVTVTDLVPLSTTDDPNGAGERVVRIRSPGLPPNEVVDAVISGGRELGPQGCQAGARS